AESALTAGWSDAVAAECGSSGRHGFRYLLPAMPTGTGIDGNVYIYGIDLNAPGGAPFTLLRGGKKLLPGGATALAKPRAAIWSGWLEPTVSGLHSFSVDLGTTPSLNKDLYRVWVNGTYVAGNWIDADPSVAGAFLLPPPSTPPS